MGSYRPGILVWGALDLFLSGAPSIPTKAKFCAFFTAGGEKFIYFVAGHSFLAVGGPPLHADGREAPDLKVQKVHRKAGPGGG